MATRGFLNERGKPFNRKSVAVTLAARRIGKLTCVPPHLEAAFARADDAIMASANRIGLPPPRGEASALIRAA
jgi:hypothetical protein